MRVSLLPALLFLTACASPQARPPQPLNASDPAVAPLVERADGAFAELGQTLMKRLTEAMGEGGPEAAIAVCSQEAQKLTAAVAQRQGLVFGRTSHRLRNPENAPRPWVRPWLDAWGGVPAAEAPVQVVALGDRVGVIRPIATAPLCTTCHGTAVDPALEAKIKAAYPTDQATGFEPGQVRGAFWAEVPRTP